MAFLQALGSGIWPIMVLLSEVVQTFILADFWCVTADQGLPQIPDHGMQMISLRARLMACSTSLAF